MFKKILIANRGEHAAGVAAKPDCAACAAREGGFAA
jgi:acetyl/propionyl-CoA carboxylase alpha subunit